MFDKHGLVRYLKLEVLIDEVLDLLILFCFKVELELLFH